MDRIMKTVTELTELVEQLQKENALLKERVSQLEDHFAANIVVAPMTWSGP